MRWGSSTCWLGILGALCVAMPAPATAQSFTYASLNTTLTVPLVLDTLSRDQAMLLNPESSDFVRDPFGNVNPAPPSGPPGITIAQRIVANQRLRYRVIGNPNIRGGGVRFTWFWMNDTVVSGSNDRAEVQWYYGSPTSLTGQHTSAATNLTVGTAGTNSWMWPGSECASSSRAP